MWRFFSGMVIGGYITYIFIMYKIEETSIIPIEEEEKEKEEKGEKELSDICPIMGELLLYK